jgi:hypothetical protein
MRSDVRPSPADDRAAPRYVIHTGDIRLPLAPDVIALPSAEM